MTLLCAKFPVDGSVYSHLVNNNWKILIKPGRIFVYRVHSILYLFCKYRLLSCVITINLGKSQILNIVILWNYLFLYKTSFWADVLTWT